MDLQTALAQAFTGPPQFYGGVLDGEAQQGSGHLELFGFRLHVPEQTAGGLGEPLERPGEQASALRRKEACRGPVLTVGAGDQFGMEQLAPLVHEPLGGYAADGDQQLRTPRRRRPGLPQ